ncbi:sterol 24-C-methyltransferase erg-4 [Colletotrichum spaethianum]|uniref:Sterol 24-C-methyltransferase n=1 Tax=Colletotrichum spaethianum TaxID=700344 RepID=A0AA37L2B9_9PEZI|nr:sterol 24-C-methyltransferase erg-4 [Colletotrichum spaethianum]GKT40562.1 sterol 24-C-methyltransferase erg-4 [Colletotrichum spaethianum]
MVGTIPEEGQMLLARDATFEKILHKGTSKTVGMSAMLKKDHEAQKAATDEYFRHWDNKSAQKETREDREVSRNLWDRSGVSSADTLIFTGSDSRLCFPNQTVSISNSFRNDSSPNSHDNRYYNLATDFYEYGFGQSFHFCRAAAGESFRQGIARHEHYLAHVIDIKKDMKVLDVGCGVGGPAREIAKFTGAYVTGLNINEYQVERATRYAIKEKMDKQVQFVQADFMNTPFEDNTFDAVYAIEATVHAPSLEAVYSEIFRVLKPGGVFGVYEWVMTENYDDANLRQRKIRIDIEQGDGIANMVKVTEALRAFRAAGFDVLQHEDMAERPDPSPWYWPLDAGSWRHAQTMGDLLYTFRMTGLGRMVTHGFLGLMETLRLAPPGMVKMSDSLCVAADALVLGGKEKIFTPMYLMVGRKPSEKK